MLKTIIRKEHKNQWERRAPLTPEAVAQLAGQGFEIHYEPCAIRAYSDEQYQQAGAVELAPSEAELVLGIKEPPLDSISKNQVHLAFSHTIKGQSYNMPLLQRFLDQGCTLIDYETIVDESGKRTIAFGRYAGIAGAVDSLMVLAEKYRQQGRDSGLDAIMQTHEYGDIETLKKALEAIDPQQGEPVGVVITGSGNVGKGAREVCQWLGLPKVSAQQFLDSDEQRSGLPDGSWYCVLSTRHLHRNLETGSTDSGLFDFADFKKRGKEGYESIFASLLGRFDCLLQTPYWTDKYPRHLTVADMQANSERLPAVIGDISCDILGSLMCTQKISDIDNPAYTYLPATDSIVDGIQADGVAVMAIDNLPCELPLDASRHFSKRLLDYVPQIMKMDSSKSLEKSGLGPELVPATITYNGKLTDKYQYLVEYISS